MWFNHWALSAGQGKNNEVLQAWRPWYLIIKPSPIRALGEVIYFAYVKKGAKLCEPFPHTLLKFHPECGPTERETEGYWGAVRGKDWGGEREREREREREGMRDLRDVDTWDSASPMQIQKIPANFFPSATFYSSSCTTYSLPLPQF